MKECCDDGTIAFIGQIMFALQLFLAHITSYWLAVSCITLPWGRLERAQWPEAVGYEAAKVVLLNQFFYTSIYLVPFAYYPQPLPGWHGVWQFPALILLTDVVFYFMHRLVHSRYLYKRIHVVHHRFDIPIAVAALYAHPLEHIFVNVFAAVVPLFIVRASPVVAFLWTAIASANTVLAHSATQTKDQHALHHRFHQCNFGVGLMLIDRLAGTFRKV